MPFFHLFCLTVDRYTPAAFNRGGSAFSGMRLWFWPVTLTCRRRPYLHGRRTCAPPSYTSRFAGAVPTYQSWLLTVACHGGAPRRLPSGCQLYRLPGRILHLHPPPTVMTWRTYGGCDPLPFLLYAQLLRRLLFRSAQLLDAPLNYTGTRKTRGRRMPLSVGFATRYILLPIHS